MSYLTGVWGGSDDGKGEYSGGSFIARRIFWRASGRI